MRDIVFGVGAAWLAWVYAGYGLWLRHRLRRGPAVPIAAPNGPIGRLPTVTILLTVHNAADVLDERLRNLVASDYPADLLDIIVASDGSTDDTVARAQEFAATRPIRVLDLARGGKSVAQNRAIQAATGDIIVLTDVDVRFEPGCVRAFAEAFADPGVGAATAHLLMRQSDGALSRSQGLYWRTELGLRAAESRAGLLAVASGGAMAVRRSPFRPIPADIGDDCFIPLDIVRQGLRVVHVTEAIAFDAMRASMRGEFRARVRMTARNWQGTWLFPGLLSPLQHPGLAVALWSHKLLRWLGAFALAAMLLAGLTAVVQGAIASPEAVFLLLYLAGTALGALSQISGVPIPLVGAVFSFGVANAGFAVGLLTAWTGRRITTYAPAHAEDARVAPDRGET